MMQAAYVNASALADWKGVLAQRGLDTARVDELLSKPNTAGNAYGHQVIGLGDFVTTVESAGKVNNRSGLSWAVGLAANYAKRGRVGRAVMGGKTLGAVFRRLVQYYPLIQDHTDLNLQVSERWTTLGYRILDPDIWPRTEDALYTLGVFAGFVKTAAPEAWSSVEISVEAEKELIRADLSDVVEANVIYGADANAIRFPTQLMSRQVDLLPAVDNDYLSGLSRLLSEKNRTKKMSDRARQLIFQGLSTGKINQDYIAKELGVSCRTLRRKLSDEGLSFQCLLDECRRRVAMLEFKVSPGQSLSEMALKLGYSEHSTFSRAFQRWAGVAPQEYRKLV
ncbi:AraC-like transcriptional regulator QhpR [Kordiimonas marina]|uniref:AraC-like transcriptional regulator QhpR n=1 Tax=Kordiimonas marina TaxID=2872312 RepID=UPI001FF119A5|nr:AraC family transcriptional regulator [Kordiimonas marina]MCJ9427966.1 AraC family transcriptional regulator [Kordiimonas marina]